MDVSLREVFTSEASFMMVSFMVVVFSAIAALEIFLVWLFWYEY